MKDTDRSVAFSGSCVKAMQPEQDLDKDSSVLGLFKRLSATMLTGVTPSTFNGRIVALRFFFLMTCGRDEMKKYIQFRTHQPLKYPRLPLPDTTILKIIYGELFLDQYV